jgi:uncharacterized C2H2 Zn-finger protein
MAYGALALADPFGFSQQYMAAAMAATSSSSVPASYFMPSSSSGDVAAVTFTPYMTQAQHHYQQRLALQEDAAQPRRLFGSPGSSSSHSVPYPLASAALAASQGVARAGKRQASSSNDSKSQGDALPAAKRAALLQGFDGISTWPQQQQQQDDEEGDGPCSHSSPALSTPGGSPRLRAGTPQEASQPSEPRHQQHHHHRELTPTYGRSPQAAASEVHNVTPSKSSARAGRGSASVRTLLPGGSSSSSGESESCDVDAADSSRSRVQRRHRHLSSRSESSGSNSAFGSDDDEDEDAINNSDAMQKAGADAGAPRFAFEGHGSPLTWEQTMILRQKAQTKFLSLRRGRRASRAIRRRREELGLAPDGPDDEESGAVDTSCPQCGKSYRQNNSFYKHLYEHHSKWDYVSETFNLSKHQQVMMMQGAELLLSLHRPLTYGLHPLVRF